ncbi:TPA: carboxymuconolactone decarboxylase family protein [Candidatus Bathyarchaeota archaeon]|nr:carboxymuconolactone decarboxylase family protein [Candidatus Bathyarchaeota archaeon]
MAYHYAKKGKGEVTKYWNQDVLNAFGTFDEKVFEPGKLDVKTKELCAVAATYITRCPYCIEAHAKRAMAAGATKEELAEVIAVAAALGAGASMAHMNFALEAGDDEEKFLKDDE